MNDQTKQLLAEYLAKLLKAAEGAAELAADQIPLVIQEKLQYDFWFSVVWTLIGLAGVSFGLAFVRHGLKIQRNNDYWMGKSDEIVIAWLCGLVCLIPSSIVAILNLQNAISISVAPRLYIIEWLRNYL